MYWPTGSLSFIQRSTADVVDIRGDGVGVCHVAGKLSQCGSAKKCKT